MMEIIKMSMFQMKIPLVAMSILHNFYNTTVMNNCIQQKIILYHFTPESEYIEAVIFSRTGKANGKTMDDLILKIAMKDQQYL